MSSQPDQRITQFPEDSDTFWMTGISNSWVFKYRKIPTSPISKQEWYNKPNLQNSMDTSCLTSSHYLLMLCSFSFSQACHPFRGPFYESNFTFLTTKELNALLILWKETVGRVPLSRAKGWGLFHSFLPRCQQPESLKLLQVKVNRIQSSPLFFFFTFTFH